MLSAVIPAYNSSSVQSVCPCCDQLHLHRMPPRDVLCSTSTRRATTMAWIQYTICIWRSWRATEQDSYSKPSVGCVRFYVV